MAEEQLKHGNEEEPKGVHPCELLWWDTDFFGVRIARVTPTPRPDFRAIDTWCRREAVQCVYFLADPTSYEATSSAEAAGFRYVDIRFTLQHDLAHTAWSAPKASQNDYVVRVAERVDQPALEAAAATGFDRTRFTQDPNFKPERSRAMYAAWVRRAISNADAEIFVAEERGALLGYCAVSSIPGGDAQILLAGVVGNQRGRGIGTQVVAAAIRWVIAREARSLEVVTQGVNIAAQRLYASNGFYPTRVGLWFHKWYPAADAPV